MTRYNPREIVPGDLLIAPPNQHSDPFHRTVVLMCIHDAEGSLGLVVNRPTQLSLNRILDHDVEGHVIYEGGPVEQDCLTYLHRCEDRIQESQPVMEDVCFCGDIDDVIKTVKDHSVTSRQIRFFVGYSGWAPGQLEQELREGCWFMTHGNSDLIFEYEPSTLWRQVLRKMGGEYAILANFPADPTLN